MEKSSSIWFFNEKINSRSFQALLKKKMTDK